MPIPKHTCVDESFTRRTNVIGANSVNMINGQLPTAGGDGESNFLKQFRILLRYRSPSKMIFESFACVFSKHSAEFIVNDETLQRIFNTFRIPGLDE